MNNKILYLAGLAVVLLLTFILRDCGRVDGTVPEMPICSEDYFDKYPGRWCLDVEEPYLGETICE
ncbi:unnamed protein product [marine sediment metagenome]|uniref:Uncharacterized protein n=1 Tax=marine sediment metagenome TaxID=412755 RepID=X0WEK4_9ZZZZ